MSVPDTGISYQIFLSVICKKGGVHVKIQVAADLTFSLTLSSGISSSSAHLPYSW